MTGLPGRSVHGRARAACDHASRKTAFARENHICRRPRAKINAFRKDRFTFSTCVIKRTRRDVIGDTVL